MPHLKPLTHVNLNHVLKDKAKVIETVNLVLEGQAEVVSNEAKGQVKVVALPTVSPPQAVVANLLMDEAHPLKASTTAKAESLKATVVNTLLQEKAEQDAVNPCRMAKVSQLLAVHAEAQNHVNAASVDADIASVCSQIAF